MSDLPKHVEKVETQDEVGASHGEVTGAWRIVRNGVIFAVLALVVAYLLFAWGAPG